MKCDVFRGIGGVAHKYYMLFQHHLPPPVSTYTSGKPPETCQATSANERTIDAVPAVPGEEATGVDPNQAMNVFVHPEIREPNYIYGPRPGVRLLCQYYPSRPLTRHSHMLPSIPTT
jgi:hypothetical protein